MRDRKGTENQVVDLLSRLECLKVDKEDSHLAIKESFPNEKVFSTEEWNLESERMNSLIQLHEVKEWLTRPWYANIANFLVTKNVPTDLSYNKKKKFMHEALSYLWDKLLYLFKICSDQLIKRCVPE